MLRQEHKAGEKIFVDWAGATMPVYDATTGRAWPASLFVSVLGASSYTYTEATRDRQLEAWIQAHIHALEFFGGVPILAVLDNTNTAVTRACRYDPDLNPPIKSSRCITGWESCPPGRTSRGTKQKPKVQSRSSNGGSLLRCETRSSLACQNSTRRSELLVRLNEHPFRKRDGSRASLFHSLEKPALAPSPAERFDMSQLSRATVNIDYHIAFDGNSYSVPYTLVQQVVEVRSTPTTVEIFYKGNRIASHLSSRGRGQTITQGEHRPRSHQPHLEPPHRDARRTHAQETQSATGREEMNQSQTTLVAVLLVASEPNSEPRAGGRGSSSVRSISPAPNSGPAS